MMEGFDKDWVFCGPRTTAGYTNLPGGKYVFRVRGANSDGLWNNEGASVFIDITPPFWQRWWFWPAIILLALMMIFTIYKSRTWYIRNKNTLLERINAKLNAEIAERLKAENALRQSEEKFRHIYENSIDVHYRSDLKGNLLMISPSGVKLLGYDSEDEMRGKHLAETFYLNPEDREVVNRSLKKHGRIINFEVTLKRKDGSPVLVETNSYFVHDSQNNIVGVEGIFRDITKRKATEMENLRLQDQLLNAKKMEAVGTLAGGMAHEFNNLMTTIIGNASFLESLALDDATTRKRLKSILKAGDRCANLTDQLLSFSRQQLLKLKVLNLNDLVQDMEDTIQRTVGGGIAVKIEAAPDLEPIKVDSELMIQVVMGIIHNARDAMPNGGELLIKTAMMQGYQNQTGNQEDSQQDDQPHDHSGLRKAQQPPVQPPVQPSVQPETSRQDRFVCLSIKDTGVGIEKEVMENIFDPFFTTKEVGKGVGLDLSFVYGTIRQHNGWIDVESELGQGATFTIGLPALPDTDIPKTSKKRLETLFKNQVLPVLHNGFGGIAFIPQYNGFYRNKGLSGGDIDAVQVDDFTGR